MTHSLKKLETSKDQKEGKKISFKFRVSKKCIVSPLMYSNPIFTFVCLFFIKNTLKKYNRSNNVILCTFICFWLFILFPQLL